MSKPQIFIVIVLAIGALLWCHDAMSTQDKRWLPWLPIYPTVNPAAPGQSNPPATRP